MPADKLDAELTVLLTKLYTIQEDVGAKPKTSDEEKKVKAADASQMGKGRAAKKSGTRFLEVKSSIVDCLQRIQRLLEEDRGRGGANPKDIIAGQAEIRELIRQASEEWRELDGLYKNEARKKRSKFSKEELEVQQTLVQRLHAEIEKAKEAQMGGYARGGRDDIAATLNTQVLASLDSATLNSPEFGGGGKWAGGTSGVAVTDGQRLQLQLLQDRDTDFDKQLDEIGDGIMDLTEIAQIQGEEVRRQNVMLENVGQKIDNVHSHVSNVNTRMKETMDEFGRSSDKLCVDIMCIVLAVGFAGVFYSMINDN